MLYEVITQEFTSGIMRRLRHFSQNHEGLEISLERSSFSKLRKNLLNGTYDFIITLSFDIEHLEGLIIHTIFSQRGAIAISQNNPKSEIENLTLDMLSEESFVSIRITSYNVCYTKLLRNQLP